MIRGIQALWGVEVATLSQESVYISMRNTTSLGRRGLWYFYRVPHTLCLSVGFFNILFSFCKFFLILVNSQVELWGFKLVFSPCQFMQTKYMLLPNSLFLKLMLAGPVPWCY